MYKVRHSSKAPATEKHDKNVEKELGNRRRVMLLLRSVDDEREKIFSSRNKKLRFIQKTRERRDKEMLRSQATKRKIINNKE